MNAYIWFFWKIFSHCWNIFDPCEHSLMVLFWISCPVDCRCHTCRKTWIIKNKEDQQVSLLILKVSSRWRSHSPKAWVTKPSPTPTGAWTSKLRILTSKKKISNNIFGIFLWVLSSAIKKEINPMAMISWMIITRATFGWNECFLS